jgi:predicted type IV restriction endonuclease
VDYAANQGVDWVILTNAAQWRIYRVTFGKPIDSRQVAEIDMLAIAPGDASQLEILYLLTREGLERNALKKYDRHHRATSRHLIAAVLLDDDVLRCIRRELRRVNPDVKFDIAEIRGKLMLEVLRRETIEGEDAEEARRMVTKAQGRALKRSRKQETGDPAEAAEAEPGSEDAAPDPRPG